MYRVSCHLVNSTKKFLSTTRRSAQHRPNLYKLTDQQKKFIEWGPLQDCKLLGTSGSGKTLSILHRVEHLIHNQNYKPENFHILTFSRLTRLDIIKKIQFHNFIHLQTENVRTMDALARNILKDMGREHQDAALLSLNFLALLETEFEVTRPYLGQLKYMFLDEAQDLRDTHIRIINILRQKNSSKVCVVGDPCQSIYQFLGCDPSFLANFDGEAFHLTRNFRSTPNIICFSEYFRNKDTFEYPIEVDNKENHGKNSKKKKEIEIYVGTSQQVEKKILREISKYHKGKSNIAILSPLAKSKWSSNIGLSWVANLLTKSKVPFLKQYKDSGMSHWKADYYAKPDCVNLTTYTGSKGQEWDFVILLDFSLFKYGTLPTLKEYLDDLNLYYVATTRAKKKLLICHKNDTGLSDQVIWKDEDQPVELKPLESNVDVAEILTQFREAVEPLRTFEEAHIQNIRKRRSDEEKESEEGEEEIQGGMRVVRNVIHPIVKNVDPEIYESNGKTLSQIKKLNFDITWLEKDEKIGGPLSVTELVSSLSKEQLSNLFENPEFKIEDTKESVYEKVNINLASIQNNEALGGIISENLLCRYLGLPVKDWTERLSKQEYTIKQDDKKYLTMTQNKDEEKGKALESDEFSLETNEVPDLKYKRLIVSESTHKVISSTLGSIKKVNSFKEHVSSGPDRKHDSQNDEMNKLDFHTVYNSILQYAFTSRHNHYILWAWWATQKFLQDNIQYISNIKLLANVLLQKNLFWRTQIEVYYNSVLKGVVDLMDTKSHVYEIKATRNITQNHILQAFLYSVMAKENGLKEAEYVKSRSSLINLLQGEIHHYDFSFPNKWLNNFLETHANRSARLLNGPLYLYQIKLGKIDERLYVYYLCIKDPKTQENLVDTYINYPEYTPDLIYEEELSQYRSAPKRVTVEKYLEQFISNRNKPIFLSLPGCDARGHGLGSLMSSNSTIIDGEEFMKLILSNVKKIEQDVSRGIKEEYDVTQFIGMSDLAFKNLDLLKDYIEEYSISFYI